MPSHILKGVGRIRREVSVRLWRSAVVGACLFTTTLLPAAFIGFPQRKIETKWVLGFHSRKLILAMILTWQKFSILFTVSGMERSLQFPGRMRCVPVSWLSARLNRHGPGNQSLSPNSGRMERVRGARHRRPGDPSPSGRKNSTCARCCPKSLTRHSRI